MTCISLFTSNMTLPPYVLPQLSLGHIGVYDADGLCHDTDVVGDGLAHIGLELFGDLAESIPDAAQDFLLLLFAHGITSMLNVDC